MAGKLFLIFRGSWAHLHTRQGVFVKTPYMEDQHYYKAGNLDGLQDIRRGSMMRLTGVDQVETPGTASVDPTLQPVIRGTQLGAPQDCTSVTTVVFPVPVKVYSIHRLIIPGDEFKIKGTHKVSQYGDAEIITSLIDIYEYTYQDASNLVLEGMDQWKAAPVGNVATLHFRAEPLVAPPPGHSAKEFQFASQLLDDDFRVVDPDHYAYWGMGDYPKELASRKEKELVYPGYGPGPQPEFENAACLGAHGCGCC